MKTIKTIIGKVECCFAAVMRRGQKDIWQYCHNEQLRLIQSEKDCPPLSEYEQGMVVAYRKVQYEIKKQCSLFGHDA